MQVVDVLNEINEIPSRSALGVSDVLQSLIEGRVRKLVLGGLLNQTIAECKSCERMAATAGRHCVFCSSSDICSLAAEEGLLRQALLTDAEILFVGADTASGFNGAAALLRY
jgi:peptide subunit release factor 1 (eRF1)